MTTLSTKIKLYCTENSKVFRDEISSGTIILQNDGAGDYIKSWTVSGLAEPNAGQLEALDSDGDTFESNFKVQETREQSYGKIGDQLDLLYKDMLADKGDKTGEWCKAIKKVKDDNPKS